MKHIRIGKLERWILTSTYFKTILFKLPKKWISPRGQKYEKGYDEQYLFKSEILLNYFKSLPLSKKESSGGDRIEKFALTNEYQKALVSVTRSINSLENKQFIQVFIAIYSPKWLGIKLTDIGKDWVKKSGYLGNLTNLMEFEKRQPLKPTPTLLSLLKQL